MADTLQEAPWQHLVKIVSERLQSALHAPPAAPNQLSVGLGGDIPVFPPISILLAVVLGLVLRLLFGRVHFLPKPFRALWLRVAYFGVTMSAMMTMFKACEAALKAEDSAQGPNFTPVGGLANTGPFAHSRNPMYLVIFALIPAIASLTDSVWMFLALCAVPVYLHLVVIPAEEALLARLYGASYEAYCNTTPRWINLPDSIPGKLPFELPFEIPALPFKLPF